MAINLDNYKDEKPIMDIKEYFNGPLKAWGIVQDWRGNVVTRFDIDMVGKWDGNNGTLDESFKYYNGKTQKRMWYITKVNDQYYTGTADDVIDKATGNIQGNAINWHYVIVLDVDDKKYNVKFDDWMWQMNDGVVINRTYMRKFGIKVGEITIFMKKQ